VNEYIFLYGSLLPELAPARMAATVNRLKEVAAGTVRGRLYDLGNYPGAVLGGRSRIRGRIFELPSEKSVLKAFDDYEGSEYLRKKCRAVLQDGRKITCWIYEYNRDPGSAKLVPGGDYLRP
jgi:gamma-glutamylcyclotransferase (GGCT)/AIG2-like uncharacterized protein YtfP